MALFLIRHAQSANNAKPESDRVPDPPITEVGERQAALLAEWVRDLRLTRLITSPFLRTMQTAWQVHQATGLQPEVRIDWHEHGGCYSGYLHGRLRGAPGMSRSELDDRFPGCVVDERIDHRGWWRSQDWETVEQARDRATRVASATAQEFAEGEERVAIVTHADFKCFFLESIHDGSVDVPMNTSVTTIEVADGGLRLSEFNQVEHLPQDLRTH